MSYLIGLLSIVYVLSCLFLIFVVLIQRGEGGGLGGAFGGGAVDVAFGGTADMTWKRATGVAAAAFIVLSILLGILEQPEQSSISKVLDRDAKGAAVGKDRRKSPIGGAKKPAGDAKKPAGDAKKPAGDAKKPAPAGDAKKPAPAGDAKKPAPAGDAKKPAPAGDAKKPAPAGDAKKPAPAGDAKKPAPGAKK